MALVIALADDVPAAQASAEAAVEEFLTRLLKPPDADYTRAQERRGNASYPDLPQ